MRSKPYPRTHSLSGSAALALLALLPAVALAQTRVQYGRITAVTPTTVDDSTGRNVGRVVGGGIGLASGSGQSSSNRALRTVGGVAAESGAAITLFATSAAGIPVSTTHTITGAIVGVGAARRLSAVRWGVAGHIVWAWVFTIPASALMAAMAFWVGRAVL